VAAIGGKDSASGTFKTQDGETLHVPTTLFAMTNSPQDSAKIVSAEFQSVDHCVVYFPFPRDTDGLPDWAIYRTILSEIQQFHALGVVVAASVVEDGGVAASVAKMCFGN